MTGWDVVIDPDDELGHRVFSVTDDQLQGFLWALVTGGVEDFRVVRRAPGRADPLEDDPAWFSWPDPGDDYIPV